MQQLYLTGTGASALAVSLFRALGLQPVGYVMLPFSAAGRPAGQLLHLLPEPGAPLYNDIPCRIRLYEGRSTVVPAALDEVAAPALRRSLSARVPMLLDDLDTALLACPEFAHAVSACLHSQHLVVSVVRDDAVGHVKRLTPLQEQLWLQADEPDCLERLIAETKPRL